jgi:hypothetical protein
LALIISRFNIEGGTTASLPGSCASNLDNTSNDVIGKAPTIPFNTDLKGLINTTTDNDYYKFVVTATSTVTLSLTTVLIDFDMTLVNSAGTQLAIS